MLNGVTVLLPTVYDPSPSPNPSQVLDGVTVLLPTVYDPSELRSDITGKLVRYLVEDGAQVARCRGDAGEI